ncbi:preprotein translocase subunit SecE [Candidatus Saccharibacteria bacterium]|nr:preprotein translocase subunit SecE [Candidatus Saccharibacteria bacterium]
MAKKDKKASGDGTKSATTVRVIKASDEKVVKKPTSRSTKTKTKKIEETEVAAKKTEKTSKKVVKAEKVEKTEKKLKKTPKILMPFVATGRYFRDSWKELRQVRWTNRRATWKMTFAVIIYTAAFFGFIMLLDMLFSTIFNRMLG